MNLSRNILSILDESSLALIDVETNFNHTFITESTSTEQSHSKNEFLFDHLIMDKNSILSLQQKKNLLKYQSPSITLTQDVQSNHDHSKTISQDHNDPIVEINLDLNDETTEEKNDDDDDGNSLPEIIFKRIIAPECKCLPINQSNYSILYSPLGSIPPVNDEKKEVVNVRRRYHHTRSRSSINKKTIPSI